MDQLAVYTPELSLYWSSLVIALGIAAGFFLSYALYTAHGGRGAALWVFLPPAVLLSILFSRLLHWYSHTEQYTGLLSALTDYSTGGFCVPGIFLGVFLAVLLVRLLGYTENLPRLLDCLAPGLLLSLALIRLSSLFNYSCRSKIAVTTPALQHLPFAAVISSGSTDYRFASFFAEFFLLLLLLLPVLHFFRKHRRAKLKDHGLREGHVALFFLSFYCAMQIVTDSTRYDSSFFPFNGFVSIVQILAILGLLAILVYYSIRSVRCNGLRWYHFVLWIVFLACFGLGGGAEYLVQRHGNWYLSCYIGMSAGVFLLALQVHLMYLTLRKKKSHS